MTTPTKRKAEAEAPAKAHNEGEVRTVLSEEETQDTFDKAGSLAADALSALRELAARAEADG